MHNRILLTVTLLIPVVLGTTVFRTVTGSVEPVHVQSGPSDVSLTLNRPISGAQAPPTLAPRSSTATPTASVTSAMHSMPADAIVAPAEAVSDARAGARPTFASKPPAPARADGGRGEAKGKAKGKHRD
jgi:hypothetical protein